MTEALSSQKSFTRTQGNPNKLKRRQSIEQQRVQSPGTHPIQTVAQARSVRPNRGESFDACLIFNKADTGLQPYKILCKFSRLS